MSRKTFLLIVCALSSLLYSPVLSRNLYEEASLAQMSKEEINKVLTSDTRLNNVIDQIANNQTQIVSILKDIQERLVMKNVNEETDSENSPQINAEIDENASELKRLLNELLIKQASLEAVFQIILESSDSTPKFLRDQFDELKNVIKSEKSNCEGNIKTNSKQLHDEHLNCLHNCSHNQQIYEDCYTAVSSNGYNEGVYLMRIRNSGLAPFYAYCVIEDNKPWMIIQRREDGSEDFYRNWQDYKAGFGNVEGEYWLGLERLHTITKSKPHELLIVTEYYVGGPKSTEYSQFFIDNEAEGFKISVQHKCSYICNDPLLQHNGQKFSTYDRDNDNARINCARKYKAAWWYHTQCYHSNLNGRYFSYADRSTPNGITWGYTKPSLYKAYMAVRPSPAGLSYKADQRKCFCSYFN